MSANLPRSIEVEPLINYPQKAEAGKTYVMTIDLRQRETDAEWPYDVEEYGVHFMLDSLPLFKSEAVGDPSVVLHRFGGTYGPAMFMLTACETETSGNMRLTLVNESGIPIDVIEIRDIAITRKALESKLSDVAFKRTIPVTVTSEAPHEREAAVTPSPLSAPAAPKGFKLRHTLRLSPSDYTEIAISWSPNGKTLAAAYHDVHLWDAETGLILRDIHIDRSEVLTSAVYSPTTALLAVAGKNGIQLWDTETGKLRWRLEQTLRSGTLMSWSPDGARLAFSSGAAITIVKVQTSSKMTLGPGLAWSTAWSPDGLKLASVGSDYTVRIWNPSTGQLLRVLEAHTSEVVSIAWSHDGQWLASGAADHQIIIWDAGTGAVVSTLSEHESGVSGLSFSANDALLASRGGTESSILLWRSDRWERVATFREPVVWKKVANPAFHPSLPALATVDDQNQVHIWDLDLEILLSSEPAPPLPATEVVHYYSAKVVLLGDSGAGKSGLVNALVKKSFTPTASTHGCQILRLNSETITAPDQTKTTRDIFLWDLAGQPNYRLLHALELTDMVMALIVFDPRHDPDPFASLRYWDRVVRQAEKLSSWPITKMLVAARTDRGGPGFTEQHVRRLTQELGFDHFFTTSAKEGWGIKELAQTILDWIDWTKLPMTTSPAIFSEIREFIFRERESGVVVVRSEELYRLFSEGLYPTAIQTTQSEFITVIAHLSTYGLIKHLPIGDFVLLQPEYINIYASAIINAAREEPDGLGSISEAAIRNGNFRISDDDRAPAEQEQIILLNVVEMLLKQNFAWRENTASGPMLVFPSRQTRESPKAIDARQVSVIFSFEGILESVYATLVVGLYYSGIFSGKEIWKNEALFTPTGGGACGISLRAIGDGEGELSLFYESDTSDNTRIFLERFVWSHLRTHAIPDSVKRRKIFICSMCSTPLSELTTNRRRERGFDWIACPVCETRISLDDPVSSEIDEVGQPDPSHLPDDVDSGKDSQVAGSPQSLTIFLSSTFTHFRDYHDAVVESLTRLGHRMSLRDLREPPETLDPQIHRAIRDADLYLLIVGWKFGYVPSGRDGRALVEMEYDIALELKSSILVFLADEESDLRNEAVPKKRFEAFRERLLANHIVTYFSDTEDLKRKVVTTVAEFASSRADERARKARGDSATEIRSILNLPAELTELLEVKESASLLSRLIGIYIDQVDQFSVLLRQRDELHKLRMSTPSELYAISDFDLLESGQTFLKILFATLERLDKAYAGTDRIDRRIIDEENYRANLKQHIDELDQSLYTHNVQQCVQSVHFISNELKRWQQSVNTLIPETARKLSLTAIVETLANLIQIARKRAIYQTTEGIEKDRQLLAQLEAERYQKLQELERLQRIEDSASLLTTDDLSTFEETWPLLKRNVEEWITSLHEEDVSLKSELERVDSALLKKNSSDVVTAWNNLLRYCFNSYFYALNQFRSLTVQSLEILKSLGLNPPQ